MRHAARWMMVAILWMAPLYAESESWVHVAGGAFVVKAKELERMQASLELTVTEAAKAQKKPLHAWNEYLIQFREKYIPGQRAVEVQGSCKHESHMDTRRVFVGDEIMDGGPCYFTVIYLIDADRYSNVFFHGYA
jgi:hypothetical protein